MIRSIDLHNTTSKKTHRQQELEHVISSINCVSVPFIAIHINSIYSADIFFLSLHFFSRNAASRVDAARGLEASERAHVESPPT